MGYRVCSQSTYSGRRTVHIDRVSTGVVSGDEGCDRSSPRIGRLRTSAIPLNHIGYGLSAYRRTFFQLNAAVRPRSFGHDLWFGHNFFVRLDHQQTAGSGFACMMSEKITDLHNGQCGGFLSLSADDSADSVLCENLLTCYIRSVYSYSIACSAGAVLFQT
jgi:hypothetical protein